MSSRWQICYDYRYPQEQYSIQRHYCTWADAPVPPTPPTWHQFAACPGIYYPDKLATWSTNLAPGGCPCLTLSYLELSWDPTLMPWGGWKAINTACTGANLQLLVQPMAAIPGGMVWRFNFSWPGGTVDNFANAPCGHVIRSGVLGVHCFGCDSINIQVTATWDWALP